MQRGCRIATTADADTSTITYRKQLEETAYVKSEGEKG
jgi:hypothetical protein